MMGENRFGFKTMLHWRNSIVFSGAHKVSTKCRLIFSHNSFGCHFFLFVIFKDGELSELTSLLLLILRFSLGKYKRNY